jgi:pimeloyl-ACP methyl ester carboxylesterase
MGAHDVALWMEAMRADARLTRITVVGHSEGALLAVLAHAEAPADGIVSLEGAGRPIGDILREQLEPQLSGAELRDEAFDIIAALEQGETVDDVPRSLLSLFRPSIQPYLISWMQYDPAEELGRVDVPVLIVHGTTDLQVPLSDARRLASANPEAMLEELAGMNHVLKLDDGATIDEQAMRSYADPSWPLAQELVDALVAFAGG